MSCYNAFTLQKYYGFQKPILLYKISPSYLPLLSIAFSKIFSKYKKKQSSQAVYLNFFDRLSSRGFAHFLGKT
jgi:hypothetical protein